MVRDLSSNRFRLAITVALLLPAVGCFPIVSHRTMQGSVTPEGAEPCSCGSLVDHAVLCAKSPHRPLPGAVFISKGMIPQDENAIEPPHSKFHPVPTVPVFAPREASPAAKPLAPEKPPDAASAN